MKLTEDINLLTKKEFLSIFGNISKVKLPKVFLK